MYSNVLQSPSEASGASSASGASGASRWRQSAPVAPDWLHSEAGASVAPNNLAPPLYTAAVGRPRTEPPSFVIFFGDDWQRSDPGSKRS